MVSLVPSPTCSFLTGRCFGVTAVVAFTVVASALPWITAASNVTSIGESSSQVEGTTLARLVTNRLVLPSLELVQGILTSTASADFAGNTAAYTAAHDWYEQRLQQANDGTKAPYLACTDYTSGQAALASLTERFTAMAVHPVVNSKMHGSCFLVTVSVAQAEHHMLSQATELNLASAGPLLPMLKIAPGVLEYHCPNGPEVLDPSDVSHKLRAFYGTGIQLDNVRGLSVRLSPGVLPAQGSVVEEWHTKLTSGAFNMHEATFWSDPSVPRGVNGKHVADHTDGAIRVREWTRAANIVHNLAEKQGITAGEVCGLGRARISQVDSDLFIFEGIDHLLPAEGMPSETKMACFMGLVSHLAATPSVLRVAPLHGVEFLNAVSSAIVQSGTIVDTPLRDAGLDGSGEVIQVVDTGLDETSCFFADDAGEEVEHGYLFDGIHVDPISGYPSAALGNPSFPFDMSRRKVIQYIELFKTRYEGDGQDAVGDQTDSFSYFSDYITDFGSTFFDDGFSYDYNYMSDPIAIDPICAELESANIISSLIFSSSSTGGFDKDTTPLGHGTFVAGIAAGAVAPRSHFLTQDCPSTTELPGCVGGCVTSSDVDLGLTNGIFDLNLFCPMYDCDNYREETSYSYCLSDDPLETLAEHSGIAPAAQIAVFDAGYFSGDFFADLFIFLAGNFLWNSTDGTGARIHSNSWGALTNCELTEFEYLFETYMNENPESILIFAIGNGGGIPDVYTYDGCIALSPSLGKNILSIGASSSGSSRATTTGVDGQLMYETTGLTNYTSDGFPFICLYPTLGTPSTSTEKADIDTVAYFSSSGPTRDGRIKPELVAPGDQVFSVNSDGTDEFSCQLIAGSGTSASCPAVAGSAALVRQYFRDKAFYARDVQRRGLCGYDAPRTFQCGSFSPSAVTVKAMLINSASLMGGSREPDNSRGFGRVHLAAGMPMDGDGGVSLLVTDSSKTSIGAFGVNNVKVKVDGNAELEMRATLCWFDPPTTALSEIQLQHDLDLVVVAPNGDRYTMWESGDADTVNVIERVIVPAALTMDGVWTISVSAGGLLFQNQSYSLVITGAIVGYAETQN